MVSVPPRARITPQALALFAELERRGDRYSQAYKDKERALMRLLDLVPQWWTCNSVLDRRDGATYTSPEYIAHHDWHRCRKVRLDLLAALEARR